MRFTRTAIYNFRNFFGSPSLSGSAKTVHFKWGAGLNLIMGPNGAGKTNLLESLNILSGWGPFSSRVSGVISWDSVKNGDCRARLAASVTGETEHEIEARISSLTVLRIDGKRETSTNLRLTMPSVTFLPTDTGLIDGSPTIRRAFLDRLCALCIPVYARQLADFRKISMKRSAMLAQGRSLKAINLMFARLGGWIMEARRAAVARLAATSIAENLPALPFSFTLTPDFNCDGESYLHEEMRRMSEREQAAGRVLVGPGRMDLEISSLGRLASEALSRGQKRRLVLALVLRAARLTEIIIRRSPVLLLDDLAAELDDTGRQAACKALCETGWQIILTGVDDPFPDEKEKVVQRLPI